MTDYTQAIRELENEAEFLERKADAHRESARVLRLRMEARKIAKSKVVVKPSPASNRAS